MLSFVYHSKGGLSMDKEKILEKSRQIHQDEGMEHAESQGREIGFIDI